MENYQVALLLGGVVLGLLGAIGTGTTPHRIFCGALALFCLTFVVLEVDTRAFGIPVLNRIFNGTLRNVWVGTLWLVAGAVFIRNRFAVWTYFKLWLQRTEGMSMVVAGSFWAFSGLCDKLNLFPQTHHFCEELLECSATTLMLCSAYLTFRFASLTQLPKTERDDSEAQPQKR